MARTTTSSVVGKAAPSRGRFFNTGNGPTFQPLEIGHQDYLAVIEPDSAFWALVKKSELGEVLSSGALLKQYQKKASAFG
jgi:uncharacterized protein